MRLSSNKLKKEIEAVKNAKKSLKDTIVKCEAGLLIQDIVLKAFEEELKCTSI